MRFGNQNKADLFYSGLLWSCTYAAHFQIGKVASPIFEQKSAIFINKLNYNKQRRNRGPMSWHAASSCVWRLPWRTSLPNIVWVGVHLGDLQSKFVIFSENRLKSKIDVWLSLIWNDFFGPRPSNWGVILSFPKQSRRQRGSFHLRKANFTRGMGPFDQDFRLTISPHAIPVPHTKLLFDLNKAWSTRETICYILVLVWGLSMGPYIALP